jgi:hypothetical protein
LTPTGVLWLRGIPDREALLAGLGDGQIVEVDAKTLAVGRSRPQADYGERVWWRGSGEAASRSSRWRSSDRPPRPSP